VTPVLGCSGRAACSATDGADQVAGFIDRPRAICCTWSDDSFVQEQLSEKCDGVHGQQQQPAARALQPGERGSEPASPPTTPLRCVTPKFDPPAPALSRPKSPAPITAPAATRAPSSMSDASQHRTHSTSIHHAHQRLEPADFCTKEGHSS